MPYASAEHTGLVILAKNNILSFNIYLKRVFLLYIHRASYLNGQDNAPKLIDLAYHTGGLQNSSLLVYICSAARRIVVTKYITESAGNIQHSMNLQLASFGKGECAVLIGLIILTMYVLSVLYAAYSGSAAQAGSAVLEGAGAAVSFCLSIGGAVCLWSAVAELLERSGAAAWLSRLLRPALIRLFPASGRDGKIIAALSENVSANLLGLGNAATPAGIRAAKGMVRLGNNRARDELCLLVVINTASFQLVPTTVAAVRASYGAAAAFDIMPAVWVSSAASLAAGTAAAAVMKRLWD